MQNDLRRAKLPARPPEALFTLREAVPRTRRLERLQWPTDLQVPAQRYLGLRADQPLRSGIYTPAPGYGPARPPCWVFVVDDLELWPAMRREIESLGHEALLLFRAATDTPLFAELANRPHCFIRGRVRFPGYNTQPRYASVVVCWANDPDRLRAFRAAFALWGVLGGPDDCQTPVPVAEASAAAAGPTPYAPPLVRAGERLGGRLRAALRALCHKIAALGKKILHGLSLVRTTL